MVDITIVDGGYKPTYKWGGTILWYTSGQVMIDPACCFDLHVFPWFHIHMGSEKKGQKGPQDPIPSASFRVN